MNFINLFYFILTSLFVLSPTVYTINFKRPCKDISPKCLKESIQAVVPIFSNGVPEFGLDRLDPFYIKQLNMTLSGGINIQVLHAVAKGLRKCMVDFARFEGHILETLIHCNLTIRGRYKSSGHLMMFPVDGEGDSTIKCRNIRIHSILQLGTKIKRDGQKYLDIKRSDINTSYDDGRVSFSMTNLFKGNPEISKALLDFMNSNWLMVTEEFGGPIVNYGVKSVMKSVRSLFDAIPIDKLKEM